MQYDLTSILITISAASASFVAILGGFIASKLLSISTEREAVAERIKSINEEIRHRKGILNKAQKENDEDDALDFIQDHIRELIENEDIRTIYNKEEHPRISFEILIPHWDKARNAFEQLSKALDDDDCELNDDNVPRSLATTFQTDDFNYTVCKEICQHIVQSNTSTTYGIPNYAAMIASSVRTVQTGGIWYHKNKDTINDQQNHIEWLQFQKRQCEEAKESLRSPRGMKTGLVIFSIFSFLCIILPLIFSPFSTSNYLLYVYVKAAVLFVFFCGIASIFIYLIYLLKWEPDKENSEKRNRT